MHAEVHPIGVALTVLAALLTFVLPRRYAILPLLGTACYVSVGQVVYVGSLDFTSHRILLLCGWARIVLRGEWNLNRFNLLDRIIIIWIVAITTTHTLLVGTFDAFINRLGFAYNALGFYFLFRVMVVGLADVRRIARWLALFMAPLALLMAYESATRHNAFAHFGGVPSLAAVRSGDIRAQGPFRHPILAGTFGATTFAFILALWWHRRTSRVLVLIGLAATIVITLATSSSGPFMALLFVGLAMSLWPMRHSIRPLLWAATAMILTMQLYMDAPVWFLIDRIGDVLGGEGYHRSLLIDRAMQHIDEWWLLGTTYTAHWMPHVLPINPNMVDITNYYLRMGVDGGVGTLALFILVVGTAFASVGRCVTAFEEQNISFADTITVWALGAALLGHASAFMSVSYFDQMVVFWYMLLGAIGTVRDIADAFDSHLSAPGPDDKSLTEVRAA